MKLLSAGFIWLNTICPPPWITEIITTGTIPSFIPFHFANKKHIVIPDIKFTIQSKIEIYRSVSGSSEISIKFLVAIHETASDPNMFDHAWPIRGIATAIMGLTPIPNKSGATIAIGAPNPATPCRSEANTQPKAKTKNKWFWLCSWIPSLITAKAPASFVTW